jgi:hypothetical protein
MIGELLFVNDVVGNGRNVMSRYLPGEIEENHKKRQDDRLAAEI